MTQTLDAGTASHSPSAEFMTMVDVDHQNDFEAVVEYVATHLDKIISEVHGFDKLLIDNGKTQLNCPPAPESGDTHGGLLIRTLSETEGPFGITLKREFKIHDLGKEEGTNKHKIEIREDLVKAPEAEGQSPVMKENVKVLAIDRP
mmetsp:Transcript_12962/g.24307  ORF Transcript_12962/g.24307 Transcript_12962/m.24307 type:complete len:146 (+) Transcript_12962:331-768(+)|eukprot:CAMPEP_0178735756 /NCGR_PEP_ID=MMETSP0744-20121128/2066_1 /TAXON_ID=913974 /ORGANISM="Nitzschia punctata, Strain CCMP561" /LENGTH=145 /DNA_ID=CAMNT_0020388163 /DNA_START=219 /DNA_END=656 /DNA_ORIENTATION=+